MPNPPADKSSGDAPASSEDEGTVRNDLSEFQKEFRRAEPGLSAAPTPRRPTSGIPAQREPDTSANPRPVSGEKPRADSQTDREGQVAGSTPRRPTSGIPAQRAPAPSQQPRRPTSGLNLPVKKQSLLELNTDAGLRASLSPSDRAALDAAASDAKSKRVVRMDTDVDPDDAVSETGPSLPLPRAHEATPAAERPGPPVPDEPEFTAPIRIDGTRVDQGPLPDPLQTSPVRIDGTRVDQGPLPVPVDAPGTRVDQRSLDEIEVTPPNEPLPTKPLPRTSTRSFKPPPSEPLDDKPRKKTPGNAPALPVPDGTSVDQGSLEPVLSSVPASRSKAITAAKPRTDPRANSLLDEHTRVGSLPEAPNKPPRIENRETSMLNELDQPLDDKPRPRSGPPTGEHRIENRETSMLAVPTIEDDDEDDAIPTALMSRPPKEMLDPVDDDPTDASALKPRDKPKVEVRSLAAMTSAPPARPEPPSARKPGYSRVAKDTEKAKPAKPGEPPARRPFELSGMIRAEALQNFGQNKQGFQIVIGVVLLVLGLGAFLGYYLHGDKPSNEDLQMAYPYGFSGGRQQNGRSAPPSAEVIFDFEKSVDCGDTVCVRYTAHTLDDSFHITMDLKKNDKGEWKLVNGPDRI